jgi:hypothetical protein
MGSNFSNQAHGCASSILLGFKRKAVPHKYYYQLYVLTCGKAQNKQSLSISSSNACSRCSFAAIAVCTLSVLNPQILSID